MNGFFFFLVLLINQIFHAHKHTLPQVNPDDDHLELTHYHGIANYALHLECKHALFFLYSVNELLLPYVTLNLAFSVYAPLHEGINLLLMVPLKDLLNDAFFLLYYDLFLLIDLMSFWVIGEIWTHDIYCHKVAFYRLNYYHPLTTLS